MRIMLGLLGLGIAAAAGIVGHTRARSFVGRKLRFTSLVEKPYLGVAAGVTATVVASPLAWLPLVSVGTAIAFGTGVGTGAALGAKDAKRPLLED
jgi:hypothetical protein